jgi:hypothetical protein
MALDHSRVDMAQILGEHHQRHACHHRQAAIGMPELVDANRRVNPRRIAGSAHTIELMIGFPLSTEHGRCRRASRNKLIKELPAVIGQDDMAVLPRLALANVDSPAVGL